MALVLETNPKFSADASEVCMLHLFHILNHNRYLSELFSYAPVAHTFAIIYREAAHELL